MLGVLGGQRGRTALEACRGQDLGARLRVLAQIRAREPGVEQAAVRGVAREPDGVGSGCHAGPAPFLKGMPVANSVALGALAVLGTQLRQRHDADAVGLARAGCAVDLHEMPVGIAQEELHRAIGQAIGLAAVGSALERAESLGAPAGLGEVVDRDGEVVQRRHRRLALEEVQLAVAEAQPHGREADVRHRQPLAPEELFVETRRALDVRRRERDVIEADSHGSNVASARASACAWAGACAGVGAMRSRSAPRGTEG